MEPITLPGLTRSQNSRLEEYMIKQENRRFMGYEIKGGLYLDPNSFLEIKFKDFPREDKRADSTTKQQRERSIRGLLRMITEMALEVE